MFYPGREGEATMSAGVFSSQVHAERRKRLREKIPSGLILVPGNREAAMNYPANTYPFRQDSCFLYFFGADRPDLVGLLDVDEGRDYLFGNDVTLEDVIWTGPQATVKEMAAEAGTDGSGTPAQLMDKLRDAKARNRMIHLLPSYRADQWTQLEVLLGQPGSKLKGMVSEVLIDAVVDLRSVKSEAEIAEIENALAVTAKGFAAVAAAARPGRMEWEVAGGFEGVAASHGRRMAYPVICSMHGERLHNHHQDKRLEAGRLLLVDAGAESPGHYASDITRTYPVGGRFTPEQRDVYNLVHRAQAEAIAAIAPGKPYREVHLLAASVIASGLKDMGLLKGSVESLVERGVHALFFPHGLGHMLGLDVHDMEGLGEDKVGYSPVLERSSQFGLAYLRLAKALRPGYVLTVEPGIYFIPALIDAWKSENRFPDAVDYAKVDRFRDFGGIRLEDDVLVTEGKARVLGPCIPKGVDEVEALLSASV